MREQLESTDPDWDKYVLFVAQDIDPLVCKMCYIQMCCMRFIEFPAFTTIYVSPDSTVDLVNPESNHVYFKYTILENDEVLYESDYIAPGQKYAWQASDYITGAGEHAVVFSVSTVGVDDQQPRNGAEFAVTAVVS